MGQLILAQGVKMDPEKLLTMKEWPFPLTPKALRGLLGLTNYYY